jgi:hypothetical protein
MILRLKIANKVIKKFQIVPTSASMVSGKLKILAARSEKATPSITIQRSEMANQSAKYG